MSVKAQDQLGLDEKRIDDKDVESALEDRQRVRDQLSEVRKRAEEAHARALAEIMKLELPTGHVARVGRFRIANEAIPERSVAFTTKAKDRLSISLIEEAG